MDPTKLASLMATLNETQRAVATRLLDGLEDDLDDNDVQQLGDASLDVIQASTESIPWADAHDAAWVHERIRSARDGFDPDVPAYHVGDSSLNSWLQNPKPDATAVTFLEQWTYASLATAIVAHRHVRVIGERHSDEPLSTPGPGTLVVLASGGPSVPAPFAVHAGAPTHRWIRAGMMISDLIPSLAAERVALANLGSFTFQTFGGVFNCGTHGSGASLGCMADEVLSVDLVAGDGRLVRIERPDGPSNPGSVPNGWTLIQDTDTFVSAVVSVGLFGVAVGYNVRLHPEIILDERVEWTTFEDAIGGFAAAAAANRHAEIYINPYDRASGIKHRALVILRDAVADVDAAKGTYTVIDRNKPKKRAELRIRRNVVKRAKKTAKGEFRARLTVGVALRYLRHDKSLVGPWWEVLRRDTFVRAHGFEVFVPAHEAERAGTKILAMIAAVSRFEGPGVKPSQVAVANTPIGMRVIRASDHRLAMTHRHYVHTGAHQQTDAWVSFEVPRLVGTPNPETLPRAICNGLTTAGIFFRTHWGQYAPTAVLPALPALYPSFAQWHNVRAQFDPSRRFVTPAMAARGL